MVRIHLPPAASPVQTVQLLPLEGGRAIGNGRPIDGVCEIMERIILAHLSRILLLGIAHTLGSLGIFCLYGSYMGAPLATYAIVCLSSATTIVLACGGKTEAR